MYENDEWQSSKTLKVAIQTVDRCNNSCLMCPGPFIYRTNKIMSDNVFIRIVSCLLDYMKFYKMNKIKFDFFLQNEPLLDPLIFKRIEFVKKVLPGVRVEISSNGLLVPKYKHQLLKLVDYHFYNIMGWNAESYNTFHGTNINQKFYDEMITSINDIKKHFSTERVIIAFYNKKLAGNLKNAKKWYKRDYSRGGFLSNDKIYHNSIKGCYYDKHKFWNFLVDGNLILCYQDWRRQTILGNIIFQNLFEIESSTLYKTYILKVEGKIKSEKDFICKKCELSYGDKKFSKPEDIWQPEIFKYYN